LDDGRSLTASIPLPVQKRTGSSYLLRYPSLSASDAAKLALQANVKQLYLTHISARYTEEGQRLMLERQAQTIFPASKVVGDFDVFDI
jgi:ribonuclease Z